MLVTGSAIGWWFMTVKEAARQQEVLAKLQHIGARTNFIQANGILPDFLNTGYLDQIKVVFVEKRLKDIPQLLKLLNDFENLEYVDVYGKRIRDLDWFARAAKDAAEQKQILECIEYHGGYAYSDRSHQSPAWISSNELSILDTDVIDLVKYVTIDHSSDCDDGSIPEYIYQLEKPGIDIMSALSRLPNLEELSLNSVPFQNLDRVKEFKTLKSLGLHYLPFKELSFLEEFVDLESLSISSIQVTDLSPLKKTANLERLDLYDIPARDYSSLKGLTKLRNLMLLNTNIVDLSVLQNLNKIENLCLYRTRVKDVTPLAGMKNLKILDLRSTQVSASALKNLKAEIPNCFITHSFKNR